jgi:AcrR family transcriptional regulator
VGPSTSDRILEHARDLFVEAGMAGFSMRRLAERVGVSAPAIYRHYQDKEAVLLAVVDAGYDRFASYLARALAGITPADRLDRSGEGYARFAVENPAYYRLMFMSSRDDFGYVAIPAQNEARHRLGLQMLIDRIRECQEAKLLRAGEPIELALVVWSLSHGLCSLYLTGHLRSVGDGDAFVQLFRRARRELIEGLGP